MSQVANAIKQAPFQKYLMGYVVGLDYQVDGGEWLFNSLNELCGSDYRKPKQYEPKYFPTVEKAAEYAGKIKEQYKEMGPVFHRPYIYGTPNPKNAEKMPLFDSEKHGKKVYV